MFIDNSFNNHNSTFPNTGFNSELNGYELETGRPKEIAFIDSGLPDYQSLLKGLDRNVQIFLLDSRGNEFNQITQVLKNYQNLDAIHLFSHGLIGGIKLGDSLLNQENLGTYQNTLYSWGQSLNLDGDLLFYGCNVAEGTKGQAFLQNVSQITQADVAGSTNLTGSSQLGGDWVLEYHTGTIEAHIATNSYNQVLGDISLNNGELALKEGSSDIENVVVSVNDSNELLIKDTVENINISGDRITQVDAKTVKVGISSISKFKITTDKDALDGDRIDINLSGLTISHKFDLVIEGDRYDDAVTFSGNTSTFGGNINVDAREININNGVIISSRNTNANSGNITLKGKEIYIKDNVQLLADVNNVSYQGGDINIEATKFWIPSNDPAAFLTDLGLFGSFDDSRIIVGQSTILKGNNINLSTDTGGTTEQANLLQEFTASGIRTLADLILGLPVMAKVKKAESIIHIGNNSQIIGSGNVNLESYTNAKIDIAVIGGDSEVDISDSNDSFLKKFSFGLGVAITKAETTIGENVIISAQKNVSILSDAFTESNVDSRTSQNLGIKPSSKDNKAMAFGISYTEANSYTNVAQGAVITAGGNANVLAIGNNYNQAAGRAYVYKDGTAGTSLGLGISQSDIRTEVNGTIKAQGSTADIIINLDDNNLLDDNLSTIKLLQPHNFKTGDAVVYKNSEFPDKDIDNDSIGGLVNDEVYYVIVDSSTQIRLADSRASALAKENISFNKDDKTGTGHHLHALKGLGTVGVGVKANLESTDIVQADSGIFNNTFLNKIINFDTSAITSQVKTTVGDKLKNSSEAQAAQNQKDLDEKVKAGDQVQKPSTGKKLSQKAFPGTDTNNTGSSSSWGIAGALAVTYANHDVTAKIGSTAKLESNQDLEVNSFHQSITQIEAITALEKVSDADKAKGVEAPSKETAISASVSVGFYDSDVKTEIADGAKLDASRNLAIQSEISYPFAWKDADLTDISVSVDSSEVANWFTDFFTANTDIFNGINTVVSIQAPHKIKPWSSWTKSASQAEQTGISGSINVLSFNNTNQTIIGSSVEINQKQVYRNADQSVAVKAKTDMTLINITGDPLGLIGSNSSGGKGVGGSVFFLMADNNTEAIVKDGAKIHTGDSQKFSLKANTDIFSTVVALSGGIAEEFGIAGSVVVNLQYNRTIAQLGSGAIVTGGGLDIIAQDETDHWNFVGGVIRGSNTGIGMSVGVHNIEREVQALIGNSAELAPGIGTNINVKGDINIKALAEGDIYTLSLAAAVITQPTPKTVEPGPKVEATPGMSSSDPSAETDDPVDINLINKSSETGNPIDGIEKRPEVPEAAPKDTAGSKNVTNDQGNQGKSGIGISGDVSIHLINDNVLAYINDAGTVTTLGNVAIEADNDTNLFTISGSASFVSKPNASSTGIAGSVAVNIVSGETKAYIVGKNAIAGEQLSLTANSLTLAANRTGDIFSIAAGGSGAPGTQGTAIAGSVSVNNLTNTTESYIDGGVLVLLTDILVKAKDDSDIFAIAGAIGYGGRAGVGAAIGVNIINNDIKATLKNSTLNYGGKLDVLAENNTEIQALSGAIAASSGQLGGAGTVSVNIINGTTEASVVNTQQAMGAITPTGAITVTANNNATIQSLSGAVGASKENGFGAALAYNGINDSTRAYITGSTLSTTNSLTVAANSDRTIKTIALGLAGGKDLGLAGSAAVNIIDGTLEANIANSTITSGGKVEIKSLANDDIEALAGGVGISLGTAGVGAAISINQISNRNRAYIFGSTVTSQSDVNLEATTASEISSITIGGGVAKTFALGGSISVNTIDNSSEASIEGNSQIQAANLNIIGKDSSTIESLAGSVGLSTGTAAVAAAIAVNYISNQAKAYIDNSKVNATGIVTLAANSTSTIKSLSASGAATTGTAAVSGSFSINIIGGGTQAYITHGSNVAGTGINLSANNNSTIQSLAGNIAGGGTAAVGISLAVNDLDNTISTYIENSSVTASNNQVSLTATSTASIESIAVGGAGAGTAAVGGSVSVNIINTITDAHISNYATVNAANLINVLASDNSTIKAIAGQVSVGGTAGVGASVSTNYVKNQAQAYISGSQVTSTNNGVTVQATLAPNIANITAGGAGAGTAAVGGSVTVNNINTATTAYISNHATVQAQQNVQVLATNNATIQSLAGQISGAGTAAIGAAVAVNNSSSTTQAYISDSSVTSTAGQIKASATGTGSIESLSAGASVSGQVALTGSVSVNNITDSFAAYTNNANISANSLEIAARDEATIKSFAGQISVGLGAAGIGASVAYNNIGNTIKAYSQDSTINTVGNVLISADSKGTIETVAAGGSGGLYVGLGGSVAVNEMSNNVLAYIQGGNLTANGSVGVLANSVNSMTTKGGTVSAGLVGVGATIVVNNLNNSTKAYLSAANVNALGNNSLTVPLANGNVNTEQMRGLAVIATSKENLEVKIGTGSAGALGLAATIAVNSFNDTTQAYINGGLINSSNTGANGQQSVFVKAFNDSKVDVKAGAAAVGGAGVGATIDVTTVKNSTFAYINNATVNALQDVDISAKTTKEVNSLVVAASGGLGLGVSGAVSVVNVSAGMSGDALKAANDTKDKVSSQLSDMDSMGKDSSGKSNIQTNKGIINNLSSSPSGIQGTTAFISGTVTAGGQINILSDETTKLGITSGAVAFGGSLGVGGSVGIGNITHNTSAYIGANTNLTAGGNIFVQAQGLVDSSKVQAIAGAAGAVGLGAAVSYLTSQNNTTAYIGAGAIINQANNVNVLAGSSSDVKVESWGASVGALAVGVVIANAQETGTTQAYLGNGIKIQNTNNLNVNATAKEAVSSVAQAASGGIAAGSGSVPTASVSPTVKAYVDNNAHIQVAKDLQIISDVTIDGDAEAKGVSAGLLAVGVSIAEVNSNPNIDTHVGTDVVINANNITVQSRLGKPVSTEDTSFNPANAVNNAKDTINLGKDSGLQTGEQIVYLNGGGTDIGGLANGTNYQVIKVDNQTIKLGSEFDASQINVQANTIKFSYNHAFQNGQQVIYEAVGGAAIGGLTSGTSYYVKVLDSKTIQLVPTWPEPQVTQGAKLSDITSNQITINAHGFNNGDAITYQSRSAQFTVVNTIPQDAKGQNNIFNLEADIKDKNTINSAKHGFDDGEEVIYSTVGAAIGGLVNGQKYFVKKVDDNNFKLSATKGGADIDLTSASQGTSHKITAVSVQGLEAGKTYYVVGANTNNFQLAATKGGMALTLDKTGLTGTGTNYLFSKDNAIDLTSASIGEHNLHFDLNNATATGSQHSLSSGVAATVPSQGDNKFSASSQASAGALVGGTGTKTTLNITPTMTTYVGDRTAITATGNVSITGVSSVAITGATDADIAGAIAVGASEINVNINNTNNTYVGNSAQIKADGNVEITGQSDQTLSVRSYGGAGSVITFADSDAHANITHNTTTTIQDNAKIVSNDALLVRSSSNTDANVKAVGDGVGFYADADASSSIKFDGSNTTNINANARLEGRNLTVEATVDRLKVESRSESEGAGLIGNIDAHAKVDLTGTDAIVNLGSGANLKGDIVTLDAQYKTVSSNAIALADCDGLGGDTDSDATNIMPITAKIWTDSTSSIQVNTLNVKTDFETFNKTTNAHSDKAWELDLGLFTITMDFGSEDKEENYKPTPIIDFNSTVILDRRDVNPVLIVDKNGNITQQSDNIIAKVTATEVIINDIENVKVGGVNFIITQRSNEMFNNGAFIDKGKYTVVDPAYETVQIENNSNLNLVINNISVINLVGLPEIKYDRVNVNSKTIATSNIAPQDPLPVNPTVITIENNGNSNLILQGAINSPHDRTVLYSGGSILSSGADQKIITRDLTLTALNGSIGTDAQRIVAQIEQGYNPVTVDVPSSNIDLQIQAQNSIFLDLTAKQLNSNPVTVNVAKMTANTGDVNLLIQQTTDASDTAVSALYDFTKIVAGNDIIIDAGTTTTNIKGNTDFVSNTSFLNDDSLTNIDGNTTTIKGLLDVVTGGYINLTEVAGGLNIKQVVSAKDSIQITVTETTSQYESLLLIDSANVSAAKDINFSVGDNFQINTTATITAGQNVVIKADDNNQDANGSLVNIFGAIYSQWTEIYSDKDPDIFNIRRIDSQTYVWSKAGNDTINVGSKYPNIAGLLDNIDATLIISGGIGSDTLNIDDSGNTKDNIATIGDNQIRGLGMGGWINYGSFEKLNVKTGLGNDVLTVESTHNGETNIDTANGNDNIYINSIYGVTTVRSSNGDDNITVSSSQQLLDDIANNLTISGGIGSDILNIDGSGDTKDNIATIGDNQIRGLGMGGWINYGSFEKLNVKTGLGNDVLTVESTHNGETNIDTANGNDNIYINSIYGVTTVRSSNGDDNITVSSSQQLLDDIANNLTISGGIGSDILNIDGSGDTKDNIATIGDNQIRGLGMGGWINYGSFEKLNVKTGLGNDVLTVESTHNGETNIDTANGNDNIYINSIYGVTTVRSSNGDDNITASSFQQLLQGNVNQGYIKLNKVKG
ncbi:MAG: DUF4347 domain-containing protein [Nostoc sp. DedSLP03]|uniref:DUF4347 domain-containing protein n=1 Tax=Nostoc sp. DedSLP03 TaxID=3075400 RepID=UPI002AD41FB2|nr:DUF4347 domain-containing protein [Nostoc sp. DedSLP03]MDZ7965043.1 DUF4347 domain-containing protein [Nostoc sp. DedSLP03]